MADFPLVIVKLGDTTPAIRSALGDFEDWIRLGLNDPDVQVCDPRQGATLPAPDQISGAVLTGSHDMVTDPLPWLASVSSWVREMVTAQRPLLGICFGHQLLAQACGGQVAYHPDGAEIGTVNITLRPETSTDPLFANQTTAFPAQASHWQSIRALPRDAVHLASSPFENHHAFRIGSCAWGVQFHPEFTSSAMRAYLAKNRDALAAEKQDVDALLANTLDTPHAATLLSRFAQLARAQ